MQRQIKKSKYKNKRCIVAGKKFPSLKEARCYLCLLSRQQKGEIFKLQTQVRFPIKINGLLVCTYVADFVYYENGNRVVHDTKGYQTDTYKLKKKLLFAALAIEIKET